MQTLYLIAYLLLFTSSPELQHRKYRSADAVQSNLPIGPQRLRYYGLGRAGITALRLIALLNDVSASILHPCGMQIGFSYSFFQDAFRSPDAVIQLLLTGPKSALAMPAAYHTGRLSAATAGGGLTDGGRSGPMHGHAQYGTASDDNTSQPIRTRGRPLLSSETEQLILFDPIHERT